MLDELMFRVTELERRLANIMVKGSVAAADYPNARVRVTAGSITTGWLPWWTPRAGGDRSWWAPEVGEQVIVFSPSGETAAGVVMPSLFSDAAPAPAGSPDIRREVYADGLVIEHDRARHITTINCRDSEGTLVLDTKNLVLKTAEGGFFHVDHHGKATRITHVAGAQFATETWESGTVVTAKPDQGYTPPKVPIEESEL